MMKNLKIDGRIWKNEKYMNNDEDMSKMMKNGETRKK